LRGYPAQLPHQPPQGARPRVGARLQEQLALESELAVLLQAEGGKIPLPDADEVLSVSQEAFSPPAEELYLLKRQMHRLPDHPGSTINFVAYAAARCGSEDRRYAYSYVVVMLNGDVVEKICGDLCFCLDEGSAGEGKNGCSPR
ncbi:MAG: hypothetical protein QW736_07115, partial [Fervidicoccaceae archaeon]